jgi:hypothetical protein
MPSLSVPSSLPQAKRLFAAAFPKSFSSWDGLGGSRGLLVQTSVSPPCQPLPALLSFCAGLPAWSPAPSICIQTIATSPCQVSFCFSTLLYSLLTCRLAEISSSFASFLMHLIPLGFIAYLKFLFNHLSRVWERGDKCSLPWLTFLCVECFLCERHPSRCRDSSEQNGELLSPCSRENVRRSRQGTEYVSYSTLGGDSCYEDT